MAPATLEWRPMDHQRRHLKFYFWFLLKLLFRIQLFEEGILAELFWKFVAKSEVEFLKVFFQTWILSSTPWMHTEFFCSKVFENFCYLPLFPFFQFESIIDSLEGFELKYRIFGANSSPKIVRTFHYIIFRNWNIIYLISAKSVPRWILSAFVIDFLWNKLEKTMLLVDRLKLKMTHSQWYSQNHKLFL